MTDLLWRIFYDGEQGARVHRVRGHTFSSYSNLDGPWTDAPTHGVICIGKLDEEPGGRAHHVIHRREFFLCQPGSDDPYAENDILPFLMLFRDDWSPEEVLRGIQTGDWPPEVRPWIKYGRRTGDMKCRVILDEAHEGEGFPGGITRRRRATDFKE